MNQMENSLKNLVYLIGAGVLILIGLFILIGIINLTVGLLMKALPLILVAAGLYLLYRWWTSRNGRQ